MIIDAKWRIYEPFNSSTIDSDIGLSPGRRHAIIWTNEGILLIRNPGTNLSEVLSLIPTFSLKCIRLENGGHFVSS